MTKFTGYARRKDPSFSILFFIAIVIILLAALAGVSWIANESLKEGKKITMTTTTTTTTATSTTTVPMVGIEKVIKREITVGKTGIMVEKIVFTGEISDRNLPTDNLDRIALADYGKIYCYTRVNSDAVPRVIRHVWIDPTGAVAADIQLHLVNRTADTWSYVSLYGAKTGNWELQVRTIDNRIIARRGFATF